MNRSAYIVTLYALLPGTSLAWLPVCLVTTVPLPDDPTRAEVHVHLIDDLASQLSGWTYRLDWALSAWESGVLTFAEVIDGWSEQANGQTWDLSVEILDACTQSASLDSLATWLDALSLGLLGDHCALQAEVEGLASA